jgi:hypothetical protein
VGRNEVRLRRIESADDLAPANVLAREFGDWATEQIRGGMGFETVYLESASFMHSAHALYRSVGFVPSDSYAGREFEGVDVSVFMRLDLV